MRQVENHELLGFVGMGHGIGPSHHAAPIVTDDDRLLGLEMLDHRIDVGHELGHCVIFDARGLIALVVAPHVDGHDLKVLGQGRNLLDEYQKSGKPWISTTSGPLPAVT